MRSGSEVVIMREKNEKEIGDRGRNSSERIDGDFLERNGMIRRAFARAKIDTYPQLYEKAKAEYNLYYVSGLSVKLIKKIQKHLVATGREGLPKYEDNLKDKPPQERKRIRMQKKIDEKIYVKLRRNRLH